MHVNSEDVQHLQGSLTLSYTESSKRLHKDQHKNWLWKNTCKLQHGTCNFWGVIAFTRSFILGLYWKFKKVTQRSTSNLAENLMRRRSLPVKLQHDESKFCGIIIFTRSNKMLPFEHDLVQKVRQKSTSNLSGILMWRILHDACNCLGINVFTRQPDLDQVWKFRKVTQRSTSNSFKILMCKILLSSYNLIQAIYKELSCSQGPSRLLPTWNFTKGHTKVNIKRGWDSDE